MSLKTLNERDARAIDALLMNGRDMDTAVPLDPQDLEAIRDAGKALSPLDTLVEVEVPHDLAARTMRYINGSSGPFHSPAEDRPLPGAPNA